MVADGTGMERCTLWEENIDTLVKNDSFKYTGQNHMQHKVK